MPQLETIYLVHHSHTDIGYTHDQPVVWELHTRFIDEALRLAEKHASSASDGAFRWTVETTVVLQRWLETASARDVDRLIALERAGRVEVTGMFANLTPLLDTDQLIESFQILRRLRADYGFNIRHAMNCDVNGENWPLVDVLLDLGIEGFTMAINAHFGGPVRPRPAVFNWQGPSGRSIPVNNGWPYDKGWREGIGRAADDLANVRLEFANGCVATLTSSRVSAERIRKLRLFEPDCYHSIDYSEQAVSAYRLVHGHDEPRIEPLAIEVAKGEPLAVEHRAFQQACLGTPGAFVDGSAGTAALAAAVAVVEAIERAAAR